MNGTATMEGYLHKKGHTLPTTQRRYCVLKGTMLTYYSHADEYIRKLTPRNVLEVIGVRDVDDAASSGGFLSPSKRKHAFEIEYLGGTTYLCNADSREEKQQWLSAIQHALDEPNRIIQDEIEDAQRHLEDEALKEEHAMAQASEAVSGAQQFADEAMQMDIEIKSCKSQAIELEQQLHHAEVLLKEAEKKTEQTRTALSQSRSKAHDAVLLQQEGEDDYKQDDDEVMSMVSANTTSSTGLSAEDMEDRVARLAAQLEVDETHEATQRQLVASINAKLEENARLLEEYKARAQWCAEEGRKLREAAASSLQSAQSAKQISRLRLSSWTTSSSHLDPLAEGYLLCKHPLKPSMHRRYCVLYGNTFCWYKDIDDFNDNVETPSGVVHVAAVAEWSGKVGGLKTFPHAFAIATVEGKTLYCSAPIQQSAVTWETALHIGLTMPALSPHRAMQAKARRDSLDLVSVVSSSSGLQPRKTSATSSAASEVSRSHVSRLSEGASPRPPLSPKKAIQEEGLAVAVEGYLVKKSALFPVMKKKYCVLHGLKLAIFESHDQYTMSPRSKGDHEDVLVCGVSEWDGHSTLMQYHHGFQIHTVKHHMIQCSAANENEKAKWMTGIHEALLTFKDQLLSPISQEEHALALARSEILATTGAAKAGSSETPASQFRKAIEQFYVKHHPTKAHDVPMLLTKYTGRERALVAHLDRIYGTDMTHETDLLRLIEALEAMPRSPKPGRRRLSSGVRSGLREFGKMTGYLQWISTSTPPRSPSSRAASSPKGLSFSVLSVDKLVRYTSETVYETEPYNPIEAVQVLAVNELTPATTTGFSVKYQPVAVHDKPHSPTNSTPLTLQLEATSTEQKVLWMAKLRSGLGFAAASKAKPPPAEKTVEFVEGEQTQDASQEEDRENAVETRALRSKLIDYYRDHNPRRIAEVDTLLHYFHGRELQLLVDLDATYGTSIHSDKEYLDLLPTPAVVPASVVSPLAPTGDDEANELKYESYVWIKHPALGSGFCKCYCVVRNTHWSCFEDSREAHAFFAASRVQQSGKLTIAKPPLLSDTIVNVTNLNAKLHEMRVLSFEGETNSAILLRADVDPLFHDWMRVLRQAADLHHQLASPVGDQETEPVPVWWQTLHDKLVAFYQAHHKEKAGEVTTLLRSFQGRERALLEEIDRVYHSQLARDPEILALIPSQYGDQEDASRETSSDAILMEGYLVKRGHLVPSMRKRYCVLVKNVLTYYLTHEDSRNSQTAQPLGSFRVEIVSDWHGKTTTQTYEHGMELETHDGKTFFCSAFSNDEKTCWMRAFQLGIAMARAEDTALTVAGEQQEESDEVRAKREQFREWLVSFYQQHNPRKIADLDLLLACYKGREIVMLEAMDATYGTQLLQDPKALELLPPLDAHTQGLRTLEYDGLLERAAGGNSDIAWKHATPVYVALKGLTLSFYASREGFKAGAAALSSASDRAVTVLAVKAVDTTASSGLYRFAIETTDHVWMYFQAPNALEKTHWLQLLQAALDGMLANTILESERAFLAQRGLDTSSHAVLLTGFLAIRMDFVQALAEYQRQLQSVVTTSVSGSPSSPRSPLLKEDFTFTGESTSTMKECFVVLQNSNELVVFPDDDRSQSIATLTALSTCAWKAVGGLSPTSSATVGKYPFQVLTQEQVVLCCGAATDLERATWIQQIRAGAQQAAAIEMLEEQLKGGQDDAQRPRRASVLDETTGDLKGYLYYHVGETSAKDKDEKEGYVVLTPRGGIRIFQDESAFLRRQTPVLHAHAVEIDVSETREATVSPTSLGGHLSKLFTKAATPSMKPLLSFTLHVSVGEESESSSEQQIVVFSPASVEERTLWADAIVSGINLRKGEQLLEDEKRVLAIEAASRHNANEEGEEEKEGDPDHQFVYATSAMEGELAPWRPSAGASSTIFAILEGCQLRGFASREVAAAHTAAQASLDGSADSITCIEITAVADWVPPDTASDVPESLGFQLHAANEEQSYCFTAVSVHAKRQWIHAIQHELDFALAEKYLDEDAREFARLAAIHLAADAAPASADVVRYTKQSATPPMTRLEGYVRVRHQFVGSMWRERFAIVLGTSLWIFKDGGEAVEDDWQQRAMERHELITAQEWHVSTAAAAASGSRDRHGLQLENHDGAMLELTFGGQDDRDTWLLSIQSSLAQRSASSTQQESSTATSRFISRDQALPFVPGASMEGFLKIRTLASSRLRLLLQRWKTHYAVLIGTQWLLYETQQQALALHGHNASTSSGEGKEEGDGDVLPQAVLEVVLAEPWQISGGRKSSGRDEAETLELLSHGFRVVANKASVYGGTTASVSPTGGDVFECMTHTSLERKRWLNAIEDQIVTIQREQELVRHAVQQQSEKSTAKEVVKTKLKDLQEDANRHSMYLKDVLASLQPETSSEEESEESESGTDGEGLSLAIRSRSFSRIYSPENSPKYRSATTDVLARRATVARTSFHDDMHMPGSPSKREGKAVKPKAPWFSLQTIFSCCFDRPPASSAAAAIVPIKNPMYAYKYYHEDAPSLLDDV